MPDLWQRADRQLSDRLSGRLDQVRIIEGSPRDVLGPCKRYLAISARISARACQPSMIGAALDKRVQYFQLLTTL